MCGHCTLPSQTTLAYADERNGFNLRNTGNDTEAQSMWAREQEVAKWIDSPQFQSLRHEL